MALGFRRSQAGNDYVFVDGRAVRVDAQAPAPVDARSVAVPGQVEAGVPLPSQASAAGEQGARQAAGRQAPGGNRLAASGQPSPSDRAQGAGVGSRQRQALQSMNQEDAFALRDDAVQNLTRPRGETLFSDDRRKLRNRCIVFGVVLFALTCFSFCISEGYGFTLYSPVDVLNCIGTWFRLTFIHITQPENYARASYDAMAMYPMYLDVMASVATVFKYLACGALLALSGMLYQNTFRNPIAAPTILGVSSGMNLALLVLVLMYGYAAKSMHDQYIAFSFAGGLAILLLVMLGGRLISGKGAFNVVNLLLMGTIVSQMINVAITWVSNMVFSESQWVAYYEMQAAMNTTSALTYVVLAVGFVVSTVPVIVFRFRLNLISFDDAETRLLGVNPTKLRILALACGSVMILTAQVSAGQVAMVSLVVPFIARMVFGSEFRKQLVGNVLLGALVLLVCGDVVSYVEIATVPIDLGSVVSIVALPLFVWMLVVQQRSWQ